MKPEVKTYYEQLIASFKAHLEVIGSKAKAQMVPQDLLKLFGDKEKVYPISLEFILALPWSIGAAKAEEFLVHLLKAAGNPVSHDRDILLFDVQHAATLTSPQALVDLIEKFLLGEVTEEKSTPPQTPETTLAINTFLDQLVKSESLTVASEVAVVLTIEVVQHTAAALPEGMPSESKAYMDALNKATTDGYISVPDALTVFKKHLPSLLWL
ncbi:MAG TPA: hypothetical protein DCR93_21970, partial [Cytophagales bacterium]|nr:hypothetical protein [Cytophagales bacterium]